MCHGVPMRARLTLRLAIMNQNVSSPLDQPAQPFLQVVGVHKRFTGVHALRGVSLSFERGQIYHLLGENGCGKSTLIKIISGAQPPDEGELIMDDPTTSLTQKEVDNLIAVLGNLRAQGVTVLFVSHKLDECYAIGGEVIVLRDGQKMTQGSIVQYTKSQISELMTGRHLSNERYREG